MFAGMFGGVSSNPSAKSGEDLETLLKSHKGIATCKKKIAELNQERMDNWYVRMDEPIFPKDVRVFKATL